MLTVKIGSQPKTQSFAFKYFEEKFITRGKRNTHKKSLHPYPTIQTRIALKRPSTLQTVSAPRKATKVRDFEKDELEKFKTNDITQKFEDLTLRSAPVGFQCHKTENFIVCYNLVFNGKTGFPQVQEAITIDKNFLVKLQFCSNNEPLPQWFTKGKTAELNSYSILENFLSCLRSFQEKQNQLLIEMANL